MGKVIRPGGDKSSLGALNVFSVAHATHSGDTSSKLEIVCSHPQPLKPLDPQPATRNPQPATLNPQPSTLNLQP